MIRVSRSLMVLAVATPLLAACGEGWVMQPIRNYAPYSEERTAGPGVAYVRAYMLPEKGPVLEPINEPPTCCPEKGTCMKHQAPAPASAPMTDAAPIFEKQQTKEPK